MGNKTIEPVLNDYEEQRSSFCKISCPSVCWGMSSKENHGEDVEEVPRPGMISGGKGGFTCCVPVCFTNNNRDKHLSFYNFSQWEKQREADFESKVD